MNDLIDMGVAALIIIAIGFTIGMAFSNLNGRL